MTDAPRPTQLSGLSTQEIRESVAAEISDLFRLRAKVWQLKYVFTTKRHETQDDACRAAMAWMEKKFDTRIEPHDIRVTFDEERQGYAVWARTWNILGEFREESAAQDRIGVLQAEGAVEPETEFKIVQRNSRADHELQDYGTKPLPHLRKPRTPRAASAEETN